MSRLSAAVRGVAVRLGIRRPPVEFEPAADTWDDLVAYVRQRQTPSGNAARLRLAAYIMAKQSHAQQPTSTRIVRADMDRVLGRVDFPHITSAPQPNERWDIE